MTEIIYFAHFGKTPFSLLFICIFYNISGLPGCSRNFCSLFLATLHTKQHLSLMPFFGKYVQTSNFYFLTLLSSFSSKNSIGDFDLFSFWQWSCRSLYYHFFTNKNSLLLYPFWSKYLGNTIFLIFFICSLFIAQK